MKRLRRLSVMLSLVALSASPSRDPLPDAASGVARGPAGETFFSDPGGRAVAGRGIADRFIVDPDLHGARFEIFEDSLVSNPDNRLIMPRGVKPTEVTGKMLRGGDLLLQVRGGFQILIRHQFTFVPRHKFGVQHVDFDGASMDYQDLFRLAHANLENVPEVVLRAAGIVRGWGDHDVIRVERTEDSVSIFEASLSADPHNELVLGSGLLAKDADIQTSLSDDYVLSFPSGPRITLERMRHSRRDVTYGVQAIRFADGTLWTPDTIIARLNRVTPTGQLGQLTDDTRGRTLDTKGDQILSRVEAIGGGDTFVYRHGYGSLTILEEDASDNPDNLLSFGPGIAPADVTVTALYLGDHSQLILAVHPGNGSVTLEEALGNRPGRSFGVQRVRFADGTEWTYADLLTRANGGSSFNSVGVIGDARANLLRVSPPNGSANGGGGGDTFLYDRFDGIGAVNEDDRLPHPANRLRFGSGILPSAITVLRDQSDDLYLDLDKRHGVAIPLARRNVAPFDFGVQVVEFADGTRWSKADLIKMANANPLDRNQFDQQRESDEQARAKSRAARIEAFETARTEAIYAKFMTDLDAGLNRVGLPRSEADKMRSAATNRFNAGSVCSTAAANDIGTWNRGLKLLSAQLDLKYGASQIDTASDYMGLSKGLTPLNRIGMILAALSNGVALRRCG